MIGIAAGYTFSLALKADGTVVAWGDNVHGKTTVPAGLSSVVAVSAGSDHSLALKSDGTVGPWGYPAFGENTVPPVPSGAIAIASDSDSSLVLTSSGTVVAWGINNHGQTIVPSGLDRVVAVASGPTSSHVVVLRDGSQDTLPVVLASPAGQICGIGYAVDFKATASGPLLAYQWQKNGVLISGATSASYFLPTVKTSDAGNYTVVVSNGAGSVTSDTAALTVLALPTISTPPTPSSVLAPGQPLNLSVAATGVAPLSYQWQKNGIPLPGENGTAFSLAAVGYQEAGHYTVEVTDGNGITARATAFVHLVAPYPQVIGWGAAPLPASLTNVTEVAVGGSLLSRTRSSHVLALKSDGFAAAAGLNPNPRSYDNSLPYDLGNVVAVSAGERLSIFLRSDGTAFAWGQSSGTLPGLNNIVAVDAGSYGGLALRMDGTVFGIQRDPPVGLTDVVSISAARSDADVAHYLALKRDGTVVAWSNNDFFGNNNVFGESSVPAGLNNVAAVSANGYFSVALKTDGTVVAWGDNAAGECNVPAGLNRVAAISAGSRHVLALKTDGTVVAWGDNTYGAAKVPAGLTHVLQIAAGSACSMVLRDASQDNTTLTSANSATFVAGQLGNFTLTTMDAPTATFSATNLPAWAALGSTTGILSGTPPNSTGSPFTLTVAAKNGITANSTQTLTVNVIPPYAAWQAANFSSGEQADPLVSGPGAILGPGSAPNLLKYALGVAPRTALPASLQTVAQAGGDWTFTYQRPANRVDLTYTVEISTDLQAWTSAGVTLQRTATADANGLETWAGSYVSTAPRLFFRLKVTAP